MKFQHIVIDDQAPEFCGKDLECINHLNDTFSFLFLLTLFFVGAFFGATTAEAYYEVTAKKDKPDNE